MSVVEFKPYGSHEGSSGVSSNASNHYPHEDDHDLHDPAYWPYMGTCTCISHACVVTHLSCPYLADSIHNLRLGVHGPFPGSDP